MFGLFKKKPTFVSAFAGETRGGWWTVYARYSDGSTEPYYPPFTYIAYGGRKEAEKRAKVINQNKDTTK